MSTNTEMQNRESYPSAVASIPTEPSTSIATDREQLALAFRLAENFGFHEGICNHFSVRLDTSEERYLINPYGLHWSQIYPEDLLMIDGEGRVLEGEGVVEDTARFIHVAAHRANPRHKAVLHTHMPYATTLTMLEGTAGTLPMTHQTATRFFGRMGYETTFGGLAHDCAEGERIASRAERSPEIDIVFLANHGVVVSGASIALAFDDLYYLERACRQHVMAMQTQAPMKLIPADVVSQTAEQIQRDIAHFAEEHFRALAKVLENNPNHRFTF